MSKCRAIAASGKPCTKNAEANGYCRFHDRDDTGYAARLASRKHAIDMREREITGNAKKSKPKIVPEDAAFFGDLIDAAWGCLVYKDASDPVGSAELPVAAFDALAQLCACDLDTFLHAMEQRMPGVTRQILGRKTDLKEAKRIREQLRAAYLDEWPDPIQKLLA